MKNNMLEKEIDKLEKILAEKITQEKGILYEDYIAYKELKGVSDEQLNNLEKELGVILPEDFKIFYKHKNGSNGIPLFFTTYSDDKKECFHTLSVEEIMKFWKKTNSLMEEIYTEEEIAMLDRRIKPFSENEKWIPFAFSSIGSHLLYLDFNPTERGKEGQVIKFVHDPDFMYYVAENFTETLKESNKHFGEIEDIKDYIV